MTFSEQRFRRIRGKVFQDVAAVHYIETVVVERKSAKQIYSQHFRRFRMKINVYPALGEPMTAAEIQFVHPKK